MADNKPNEPKRGGWLSRFAPGVRKIVSRRADTPDNLWVKDPDSGEMLYRSDLEKAQWVTPSGRHMRINAEQRCSKHRLRQKNQNHNADPAASAGTGPH